MAQAYNPAEVHFDQFGQPYPAGGTPYTALPPVHASYAQGAQYSGYQPQPQYHMPQQQQPHFFQPPAYQQQPQQPYSQQGAPLYAQYGGYGQPGPQQHYQQQPQYHQQPHQPQYQQQPLYYQQPQYQQQPLYQQQGGGQSNGPQQGSPYGQPQGGYAAPPPQNGVVPAVPPKKKNTAPKPKQAADPEPPAPKTSAWETFKGGVKNFAKGSAGFMAVTIVGGLIWSSAANAAGGGEFSPEADWGSDAAKVAAILIAVAFVAGIISMCKPSAPKPEANESHNNNAHSGPSK